MSASSPHPYIPNTDEDRRAMLDRIGVRSVDELFADIPAEFRISGLNLPPALPELDLTREMSELAARNVVAGNGVASFLGGGAYRHFIPSTVGHIISRSEYYTAYTPYQPEISQGTLQTMFELQSMVCELTGMDVANAGMYDGASALAVHGAQAIGPRVAPTQDDDPPVLRADELLIGKEVPLALAVLEGEILHCHVNSMELTPRKLQIAPVSRAAAKDKGVVLPL